MEKSAIDMMPRKLPGGEFSHTGSWAYLRANQFKHVGINVNLLTEKGLKLESKWLGYDTIYLWSTLDFEPYHPYVLNVFDGPQEHVAKFFERLIWSQHDHIKFVSLDYPMPDYGYRCKRKRDRADADTKMSDYWRKVVDWDKVQQKCDSITDWVLDPGVKFLTPPQSFKDFQAKHPIGSVEHLHKRLIIGDSHAHSVYVPKSIVLRKDGRTLRGICKKGIEKEITDFGYDYSQVNELVCYWGNIDIRHHLCREAHPVSATYELLKTYETELRRHADMGKMIEVVSPVPIEDESRKLPSTGYFEKTPFYGSRAERQEIVEIFREELQKIAQRNDWKYFSWPEHWYKMDGIEFYEQIMERPRSVHIARKFYRWDLEHDIPNPNLMRLPAAKILLEF